MCSSDFFISTAPVISKIYSYGFYPKYESTVVDVESELLEKQYFDEQGIEHTKWSEMHSAVLAFTHQGKLVRVKSNIVSETKPKLGDKIFVSGC